MEQFERIQVLGRGSYGLALLVRERGNGRRGQMRVIKEIDLIRMSTAAQHEAQAEAGVLRSLSHINIIAHYTTFIESSKLHIVMEYADGGDIARSIKQRKSEGGHFNQDEALSMFMQCCLALQHVHLRHVLHRDLKCPNIFLTKAKVVKLGDFGIAKVLENTAGKAMTMIGTPSYLPPEVVDNKPYGIKADIWSLGVVLYELLVLEPPFQGHCLAALVLKIVTTEPKPVPAQNYSEEVRRMVTWCLQKDPEKRPSTDELLDLPTLRHDIGLLPSEVIEHLARAGPVGPPLEPMPVATEALDVTRLPAGRRPLGTEAPMQALPGGQSPIVQRPRRRSKPTPKKMQQEIGGEQEPPLQRRGAPTTCDHPSAAEYPNREATPEANNAPWHTGLGGALSNAGGDAVDEFLLNRHVTAKSRQRPAGGLDAASPRDGLAFAVAGRRVPPRNGRPDVPLTPVEGAVRGMRTPDFFLGNAPVVSTPRSAGGEGTSTPSNPRREAKARTPQMKDEFASLNCEGSPAGVDTPSPLVGLAVPLRIRKSPRGPQLNYDGDFPSMSEIALPATPSMGAVSFFPATPSMGADAAPIGLSLPPTPGGPLRPRESPRGPGLGLADGRRDGNRKPRSSIGLVGAGMVAGGRVGPVSGALGHRPPGDDVSAQSMEEEKSSARPCRSPAAAQVAGLAGNELADISNLFSNQFARELMACPLSEQLDPAPISRRPAASPRQKEDEVCNLFGETFALELQVYPGAEPSIAAPWRNKDDSLKSELARLYANSPDQPNFTNAEASRPDPHIDDLVDYYDEGSDALSDSWHAAKAVTQELEFTLTTPYSVMP